MTFPTVADLKTAVSAQLAGMDLDLVNDLYGCFERARSTLIQKADVPEASARQSVFLYDGVFDYPGFDGIFASSLVDLRPQGQTRLSQDTVEKTYIERFDRHKGCVPSGYLVSFEYRRGNQIVRIADAKTQPKVIVDSMGDTTGWVAAGNASGLSLDRTVYYQQPGALRFNLAASVTVGTLAKTLTNNGLDLTDYKGVGVAFLALMEPSTHLASVELRIGSDANNYYSVTATTGFAGSLIALTYQLMAFDLATATTVGSPTITAMDYVELLFTSDGTAMNNVRVGGLWISLPSPHEALYYSSNIFLATAANAAPSASIAAVSDQILLSDAPYNIFVREAARAVAQQEGAGVASSIVEGIDLELDGGTNKIGLYDKYRGSNPSEELRQVDNWYYG